jgi:hypothetical protein
MRTPRRKPLNSVAILYAAAPQEPPDTVGRRRGFLFGKGFFLTENLQMLEAGEHTRLHNPRNPIPRHLRPERRLYMKTYLKNYRKTCARKTPKM